MKQIIKIVLKIKIGTLNYIIPYLIKNKISQLK